MGLSFPFWVNFSVFHGDFLTGDLPLVEPFLVSYGCLVVPLELSLLDPLVELSDLREDFLLALSFSVFCQDLVDPDDLAT